jgi:hypothetical protein
MTPNDSNSYRLCQNKRGCGSRRSWSSRPLGAYAASSDADRAPRRHDARIPGVRTVLLTPAIVRDLSHANRADSIGLALSLRYQNVDLPQLRDDLFRIVSLLRHCGPPPWQLASSGRTTSMGEDQKWTDLLRLVAQYQSQQMAGEHDQERSATVPGPRQTVPPASATIAEPRGHEYRRQFLQSVYLEFH